MEEGGLRPAPEKAGRLPPFLHTSFPPRRYAPHETSRYIHHHLTPLCVTHHPGSFVTHHRIAPGYRGYAGRRRQRGHYFILAVGRAKAARAFSGRSPARISET